MYTVPYIISVLFPMGYILFLVLGKLELPKEKRPVYRLLEPVYLAKNLIWGFLFLVIGLFRIYDDHRETLYFAPLIFLMLRVLFVPISKAMIGRPFIISISQMVKEEDQNILDYVFTVLLFFLPLLCCGLLMNKLNHEVWIN